MGLKSPAQLCSKSGGTRESTLQHASWPPLLTCSDPTPAAGAPFPWESIPTPLVRKPGCE